jgi:hypothetical protein
MSVAAALSASRAYLATMFPGRSVAEIRCEDGGDEFLAVLAAVESGAPGAVAAVRDFLAADGFVECPVGWVSEVAPEWLAAWVAVRAALAAAAPLPAGCVPVPPPSVPGPSLPPLPRGVDWRGVVMPLRD